MSDEQSLHASVPDPTPDPLVEAQRLSDEHLAGWKRARADYENLKKESERDRLAVAEYATDGLLLSLMPALDYLDAALTSTPDLSALDTSAQKRIDGWKLGVEQVRKLLASLLEREGITPVATDGAFNPQVHEAVEEREDPAESGTILSVLAPGYQRREKLLRPARVVVSRGSTSNNT